MNLASQRPRSWNEVVGQDRVIALLKAILTTGKFLPKGFIFSGLRGLGKTSVSYLFARALICSSSDSPLGCGKCPSCQLIDKNGIEHHPDFYEIDAASTPGVDQARSLLERVLQPAIVGKRRVTVIDECHRLSGPAWDVFLKPLEQSDTDSVFIFATTEGDGVPDTIQSRSSSLEFSRAPEDTIMGLLASLASRNDIAYDLDALRVISRHSKGIMRDAVKWLGMAANLGRVSLENAKLVLDSPLEDKCLAVLMAVCEGDQKEAVRLVDDAGITAPPLKVVETLFSLYARSPWSQEPDLSKVAARLPNIRETSGIFLKWLAAQSLPSDALPLLAYELLSIAKAPRPVFQKPTSASLSAKNILQSVI